MTRYEQGFMTKCAEAGLNEEQPAILYKLAQETYGSGIGDMFRDVRDSFRTGPGGLARMSNRQQSFNKDWVNSGVFKRLLMGLKHPIRANAANAAVISGTAGAGAAPVAKA